MKKQALTVSILFSLLMSLFLLLAGTSAYAQCLPLAAAYYSRSLSTSRITVNIPFDFIAVDQTLPAGEYTIERAPHFDDHDLLLMRSADNHVAFFLAVEDTNAKQMPTETDLVFNKIGDEYFLSQIWIAGNNTGREVPKPRAERALELSEAKHLANPVTVCLEMQSHAAL